MEKENSLETKKKTEKKPLLTAERLLTLFCLLCLTAFIFYVNRSVKIEALYMDDLYMWSCYSEESLLEFCFPFRTSSRFRPVYWLFAWLQMAVVGTDVRGFAVFNIIVNGLLGWIIFFMGKKLSGSRIPAMLAGLTFLASRFAYYQIGQALGFMETLALTFALFVFWFLYRYLSAPADRFLQPEQSTAGKTVWLKKSDQRFFGLAVFFYILVSFTHERFIPLAALFYLALFLKFLKLEKNFRRKWQEDTRFLWIMPLVTAAGIMLLRFLFIGRSMPAGTGGTEVTETFSLSQTLRFALSQVFYLLGINDGPEYLCAIPWENTPQRIKNAVKAGIACYGLLILGFTASGVGDFVKFRKKQKQGAEGTGIEILYRKSFFRKISVSVLFAGFAGICILCSSVTIRVEMRWVYVTFAAMQLFACFMLGESYRTGVRLFRNFGKKEKPSETAGVRSTFSSRKLRTQLLTGGLLYAAYAALSIGTNLFCRGYIDNIYFMEGQNRANSIAEETVCQYGADEVLGKTVFLVDTEYEISDFYCTYFFRPYDPQKTGQGTRLVRVETLEEAREYLENLPAGQSREALFLTEDPASGRYVPLF